MRRPKRGVTQCAAIPGARGSGKRGGSILFVFILIFIFIRYRLMKMRMRMRTKINGKIIHAKTGCSHPPFTLPFPPFT
jgi:hypothetical protein